jgi:hypothetical protein
MGVRRLGGLPNRQLSSSRIVLSYAAARFQRRRMAPLENRIELDFERGALNHAVGFFAVTHFPMEDMIRLFFAILSEDWSVMIKGSMRINQDRKIFVVYFDKFGSVGRSVSVVGDHKRNLL